MTKNDEVLKTIAGHTDEMNKKLTELLDFAHALLLTLKEIKDLLVIPEAPIAPPLPPTPAPPLPPTPTISEPESKLTPSPISDGKPLIDHAALDTFVKTKAFKCVTCKRDMEAVVRAVKNGLTEDKGKPVVRVVCPTCKDAKGYPKGFNIDVWQFVSNKDAVFANHPSWKPKELAFRK